MQTFFMIVTIGTLLSVPKGEILMQQEKQCQGLLEPWRYF